MPQPDWRPQSVSPDLEKAKEALEAARNAICAAFGVLPGLQNPATTGPLVREAQRHLASWQLQPIARLIAHKASANLGTEMAIDTMSPLQAFDAGGRARAMAGIIFALAQAKEAGIDPSVAAHLVAWDEAK